jgi:aminoglycoside phosphotransferase (APT) family kinase protein
MASQPGLLWQHEEGSFGEVLELRPTWTVEPDIEVITKIVRRQLSIPTESQCVVEFLAEGAFNKVYTIKCSDKTDYVMRVTLPVEPRLKTMSEAATIRYVRYHTDIPVPRVLHYNAMGDDELGFEWMIQSFVPGTKLKDQWQHMSWLKKQVLVQQVVAYLAQLLYRQFHRIGNLYATHDLQRLLTVYIPDALLLGAEHSTDNSAFCTSEIVSIPFFYNDHGSVNIERGPYKHSRDWLAANLELALHDVENRPEKTDNEDDEDTETDNGLLPETVEQTGFDSTPQEIGIAKDNEWYDTDSSVTSSDVTDSDSGSGSQSDAKDNKDDSDPNSPTAVKARIQRLQDLLPKIFPPTESEVYILHHQDLSSNNILLTPSHALSSIIDWECVHTVPLYIACQIPKFLRSTNRNAPPPYEEDFENEFYEQAYVEGVEEHEKTQLRKFFVEEMGRTCPEWVEMWEESDVKADFGFAVGIVGMEWYGETIDEWINAIEEGEEPIDLRAECGQC